MADETVPKPNMTPSAQAAAEARQSREAAALRENLLRRKAQSRARDEPNRTKSDS